MFSVYFNTNVTYSCPPVSTWSDLNFVGPGVGVATTDFTYSCPPVSTWSDLNFVGPGVGVATTDFTYSCPPVSTWSDLNFVGPGVGVATTDGPYVSTCGPSLRFLCRPTAFCLTCWSRGTSERSP